MTTLRQNIRNLVISEPIRLVPVLALAFYLAYIPHLNYPFPLHIDEWVHLAFINEIIGKASTMGILDPFSGSQAGWSQSMEVSFNLFWVVFQQITSLPWPIVSQYCPAIIFMITTLTVYVFAKREGFGFEAALCVSLIPSTVRFLGPAFLSPVALSMLFIPLSLFVGLNFQNWQSRFLIFVFTCFLVSAHAYTAVALVLFFIPYIIINLKNGLRKSLGIAAALFIPFLVPLFLKFHDLLNLIGTFFTQQTPTEPGLPHIKEFLETYGYLPTILFVFGVYLLTRRASKINYSLLIIPLLFIIIIVLFVYFNLGIETLYSRSYIYLMLIMGIIGGYGLRRIREIKLIRSVTTIYKADQITRHLGIILCVILLVPTLYLSIRSHLNTPYYQMIDKKDYEAFVWIKDNLGPEYEKVITDPWKATALSAVSEKMVYSRIHAAPKEKDMRVYRFLQDGCIDTDFLKVNGISIVYSRWECKNPDLVEVREYIYLVK